MAAVYVSIGSNLGDRSANLRFAIEKIEEAVNADVRVSSVFESKSWGYHSDNPFYNIVAEFETDIDAHKLLDMFKSIEREAGSTSHRDKYGNYADRTLDIDIISVGNNIIKSPSLEIPHPHIAEREFVLVPLSELSPGWTHPLTGLTATDMLKKLKSHIGH